MTGGNKTFFLSFCEGVTAQDLMQIRQMLAIYALDSVNFEAMRKACAFWTHSSFSVSRKGAGSHTVDDNRLEETYCVSLKGSFQRSKVKIYFSWTQASRALNESNELWEVLVKELIQRGWAFNGTHLWWCVNKTPQGHCNLYVLRGFILTGRFLTFKYCQLKKFSSFELYSFHYMGIILYWVSFWATWESFCFCFCKMH